MTATLPKETDTASTDAALDEIHAAEADRAQDGADLGKRLASVQDLLFGDAQREIVQRMGESEENHRDFADQTAAQIALMTEMFEQKIEALRQEIRAIDRAQTAKRRKLVGEMGDAIKAMAYDA